MPMKTSDPLIVQRQRVTTDSVVPMVLRFEPKRLAEVMMFVAELFRLCIAYGRDFAIYMAIAINETDWFRSYWWAKRLNPAGIGITGVEEQDEESPTFANGTEAARVFFLLLEIKIHKAIPDGLYEYRELARKKVDDTLAFAQDPTFPDVRKLSDLHKKFGPNNRECVWACNPGNATAVVEKAKAIWPNLPNSEEETKEETPPMATGCIAVISAGHRNLSGGNAEEAKRTPSLARAYYSALEASGHIAHYVQNEDGDSRADWTEGTLDLVGRKTVEIANRYPKDMNLLCLEAHYEGGGPSGVFSIVPNGAGLRTGASTGDHSIDTWEANTKDRQTALAISTGIAELTGLPMRYCREKGVMDEHETGVGGDGFRLGYFAWTTPVRIRAVRLVVEHGDITRDRSVIDRADFVVKAAQGALKGIEAVFGNPKDPDGVVPPVIVPPAKIKYPAGFDYGIAARAFGRRIKGKTFSEDGPVSKIWLAEKDFSPLLDWGLYDDGREYFFFASGLVIGRMNKKESFRKLA